MQLTFNIRYRTITCIAFTFTFTIRFVHPFIKFLVFIIYSLQCVKLCISYITDTFDAEQNQLIFICSQLESEQSPHHPTTCTFTMDSDNEPTEEGLSSINLLQLNNTEEFPALSSNPKLSTQKPIATPPNWGSLFALQVSKNSQRTNHSTLPPLPVTPTKEMKSPKGDSVGEKEALLSSPSTAECMSILSTETAETAVEGEDANTPWDSPTRNGEDDTTMSKDEEFENESTVIFPNFIASEISSPPQKEVLPPFQFPAAAADSESDIYSTSPEPMETKIMEVEELCEAERHDTPSYIRGGLPLWDVVVNDPHRVIHAIKHMMHGIVVMSKANGAPPQEIKEIVDSHLSALRQIEILTERERVARLACETRQAADRGAQLALEKKHSVTVKETEPLKSATKFNPDAVSFDLLNLPKRKTANHVM